MSGTEHAVLIRPFGIESYFLMQPSPRSFSEQLQKRCSVRRYIEMQILSSHNRLIPPARCAARNIFSSVSCFVELCLFVPGLGQLTAKFFDIKNRGGATGFLACVKRHVAAAARKAHVIRGLHHIPSSEKPCCDEGHFATMPPRWVQFSSLCLETKDGK